MGYAIRLARGDEAELIGWIENEAGRIYARAGLPDDLPGLALEVIEAAIREQMVWVAVDSSDRPVGFALCWVRPGALHLRELDVLPDHMRRGLGRRLVEVVRERAAELGLERVTLTTFRDVEWNAALYRRLGFETIERGDMPGWLREIRDVEDRSELRRWPRVAMAIASRGRDPVEGA